MVDGMQLVTDLLWNICVHILRFVANTIEIEIVYIVIQLLQNYMFCVDLKWEQERYLDYLGL